MPPHSEPQYSHRFLRHRNRSLALWVSANEAAGVHLGAKLYEKLLGHIFEYQKYMQWAELFSLSVIFN